MHMDRNSEALQCPSSASIVSVQSLIGYCLVGSAILLLSFLILLHLGLNTGLASQSKVQSQQYQHPFYLHFLS